jgi:hypothetical protein
MFPRKFLYLAGALVLAFGVLAAGAGATAGDNMVLGTANTSDVSTSLTGNSSGGPELKIENTDATNQAITAVASGGGGGIALFGRHTEMTGVGPGVRGDTFSTAANAYGVYGALMSTGPGSGSAAVRGENKATSSAGYGVWGSQAGYGTGVYGTSPNGTGVYGTSPNGTGVSGLSANGTGSGVTGGSAHYRAVAGYSVDGIGTFGNSGTRGVVGTLGGTSCAGTYGVGGCGATMGDGVVGSSTNGSGVYGVSPNGVAVRGGSSNSVGVLGNSGSARGVIGTLGGTSCAGTYAVGGCGANIGNGVYGNASSGYAGYFVGDVFVAGTLTKTAGNFRIDNPLDPAHSYLQHSFVESPDMKDVYDGIVVTDGRGFATVRMPRWFQKLNRTFRYQLTIVGRSFAQAIIWSPIAHNRFTIRTNQPRVKISWQVTGIRHDPYANAHRIQVVLPKSKTDRGRFIYPRGYGKPRSDQIGVEGGR